MKLGICRNCRHKICALIYEPKFCRACGARNVKIYAGLEWVILAAIAVLAIKVLVY